MTIEVTLEFMTGNPQLGMLSGRLRYINTKANARSEEQEDGKDEGEEDDDDETVESGRYVTLTNTSATSPTDLPEHRGTLLCILSVPAHMIPADILQFVAPFKRHVHLVRILRPCNPVGPSDPARTPTEYMVLLQMENQESADDLFLQCNGKRFNSFEEARCSVVFVAKASFEVEATTALPAPGSPSVTASGGTRVTSIASPSFPSSPPADESTLTVPRPSTGSTKGASPGEATIPSLHTAVHFPPVVVPHAAAGGGTSTGTTGLSTDLSAAGTHDGSTCVFCMDRMESHVLTTVCNHSFHVECLVKWQDSPCPVCRFHHNNANEASTCQECQASDNLWVCLICGIVLCGSCHCDHIRSHYNSTLHAYALDIETQQVWDFAGDGFVHRLIHNKADGKLVEIPDPRQTSEERPQVPVRLSDVQEERLVHGKLEGLAYQYNTLLTSQLDEQRHFYKKQLNELLEQQEEKRRERREKMVSGADLISALRQQRRELESKCVSAAERLKKVRDETAFLLELNESLEANKEQWSASLEQARQDLETAKKIRELRVPEMEKKVEQLMLRLDAATIGSSAACRNNASRSGVGDRPESASENKRATPGVVTEASLKDVREGVDETKGMEASGKAVDVSVEVEAGGAVDARACTRGQPRERNGSGATPTGQQGHSHKKKTKRRRGR